MSSIPSTSPVSPSQRPMLARWSKPAWVIVGTTVGVAAMLLILFFGGIPGVSLNAARTTSSPGILFHETGLGTGTQWSVALETLSGSYNATHSSTGTSISFAVPNGMYSFKVAASSGAYPTPRVGTVDYNGSAVSVPITFSKVVPLGTNFAWGVPINATGTTSPGCPSTSGHYCYAIEIAGAGDGITTSNIWLTLRNTVGASAPWPTGIQVSLFSPTNMSAVASYSTVLGTWTLAPPFNGTLAGGFSLTFYTAETGVSNGLLGLEVVANGQNGFSGTVPSNPFS